MTEPIRVLALHAHPDDVEFQCAGTLDPAARGGLPGHDCDDDSRRLRQCRARCRGDRGHSSRRGAGPRRRLIGADIVCLEFRDLAIFNDDESRRRVTEALRRAAPSIILTAPPSDYIADHEMTSVLVRDACFAASCPNYATRQWDPAPVLAKIPHLYFVRSRGGAGPRRPARAGRLPRRCLAGLRRPSGRCWLATRASATGCCASMESTSTWTAQARWGAMPGRRDRRRAGRGVPPVSRASLPAGQSAPSACGRVGRPFVEGSR